jgi:hypothetical protein
MEWSDFVDTICDELIKGHRFSDYRRPIENEQALTRIIADGLRKFVASSDNPDEVYHMVTYRESDTEREKNAYSQAKEDRWVFFHDVFFAPDILIRREPGKKSGILPIEVKLITEKGPSQAIATAIGQSLIYGTKYHQSIVFLGVLRSAKWGKYRLRIPSNSQEKHLYKVLKERGIRVILREVGK